MINKPKKTFVTDRSGPDILRGCIMPLIITLIIWFMMCAAIYLLSFIMGL